MSREYKVGKCEACKTVIYSDEQYLETVSNDVVCNANCLEIFMVREQVIHRVNEEE